MSNSRWLEILRWPANRSNAFAPWYVVARRLVAMPLLWAGVGVVFLATWVGWGFDEAHDLVKREFL